MVRLLLRVWFGSARSEPEPTSLGHYRCLLSLVATSLTETVALFLVASSILVSFVDIFINLIMYTCMNRVRNPPRIQYAVTKWSVVLCTKGRIHCHVYIGVNAARPNFRPFLTSV